MSTRAQENVRKAFELGQYNLLVATSVAEEGLNVKTMNIAVMLDSVTSGRANDQVAGHVMCMVGGEFHVFYYDASAEASHAWRAQQQSEAAQTALADLASTSNNMGFADLAIGSNPLVQLNTLKQKQIIQGPEFDEPAAPDQNGEFVTTGRLRIVNLDHNITGTGKAAKKAAARAAAAEDLLAKYMSSLKEDVDMNGEEACRGRVKVKLSGMSGQRRYRERDEGVQY